MAHRLGRRFARAGTRALTAMALCAGAASAQVPPSLLDGNEEVEALDRIEDALTSGEAERNALEEQAVILAEGLATLRATLIDTAAQIRGEQQRLVEIDQEIDVLEAQQADLRGVLINEREELGRMLGGFARLGLLPPEVVAARPGAPNDMVRAALVVRALIPAFEADVASIRSNLDRLADLQTVLDERHTQVSNRRAALEDRLIGLNSLIEQRAALLSANEIAAAALAQHLMTLADEAESLSALVAAIESDREAARLADEIASAEPIASSTRPLVMAGQASPPPLAAATDAAVLLPVSGAVIQEYGSRDASGEVIRGIVIDSAPGAVVVAPLDGLARFAEPFRNFGRILILDHGGGYHSVIAGLDQITISAGQTVLAGEPVGVTPSPSDAGNDGQPMYFEVRRDGRPINPIEGLVRAMEGNGIVQ